MSNTAWFAVDKEGLADLLARRGMYFVVYELVQNCFDENGVTRVNVTLERGETRATARLVVEDDAPDGFHDLTHAFTLFAPSAKKADAEKRGRFNLGEKLVLAVCDGAEILSTTGGFRFDNTGRHSLRRRTEAGSIFTADLRMTKPEYEETCERVFALIPPAHIEFTFNGERIESRAPLHSFTATLATELEDDEGKLRPTRRQTTVNVFEPRADESATVYEMGIPVVEVDDRWHIDVCQKVPLNMDRDNITPAYLRHLRTLVLNEMYNRVTPEEATSTWVKEAISDSRVEPEAVAAVVTKLYGADAVIFDPSDPEANKIAAAQGRTVIPPRAFSREAWANVKAAQVFQPAGRVTPSNSSIELSSEGKPPIPEAEWTDGMWRVVRYALQVSKAVMGVDITVDVTRLPNEPFLAAYGHRRLMLNLGRLGHRWFNEPDLMKIDALLIHEFGHEYSADHLSRDYHDALCELGAKMKAHASELEF